MARHAAARNTTIGRLALSSAPGLLVCAGACLIGGAVSVWCLAAAADRAHCCGCLLVAVPRTLPNVGSVCACDQFLCSNTVVDSCHINPQKRGCLGAAVLSCRLPCLWRPAASLVVVCFGVVMARGPPVVNTNERCAALWSRCPGACGVRRRGTGPQNAAPANRDRRVCVRVCRGDHSYHAPCRLPSCSDVMPLPARDCPQPQRTCGAHGGRAWVLAAVCSQVEGSEASRMHQQAAQTSGTTATWELVVTLPANAINGCRGDGRRSS
jgi:hypothetical protein